MRRLFFVVGVGLAGCGSPAEADDIEREEVCGTREPLHLLEAETPASPLGAVWGSTVVGERRVAAWYDKSAVDEDADNFGAYVLDACGGNVVRLSQTEFPLVVGASTYVCDPTDGSIRRLDLDTVEAGEVLAAGYDCAPLRRQGDTLLLRNWDADAYGLLRPEGVALLDYQLDPFEYESNTLPLTPYLSRWAATGSSGENEQQRVISWLGFKLIDLETSEVFTLPEDVVAGFGIQDGEDIFLVLDADDAGDSQTVLIDQLGDAPRPGPTFSGPIDFFFSGEFGGGVIADTTVFLARERESITLPGPLPENGNLIRLGDTRFASILRDESGGLELAAWDTDWEGGWRAISLPPGRLCGGIGFNETQTAFEGIFSAGVDCLDEEYWLLPLDGSAPSFVAAQRSNQQLGHFEFGDELLLRTPIGRGNADLELIDIETGDLWTLARDIDGLASAPTPALPRASVGAGRAIEYYVRDGEQAGLWISGLPTDR